MRNLNTGIKRNIAMILVIVTGLLFISACSDNGNDKTANNNLGENTVSTQKYLKSVDSSKSLELTQDILEIDIEGMVADIDVIFSSRNDIASSLKGEFKVSDNQLQTDLIIEKNGDTIKIVEEHNSTGINIGSSNLKLIVEIPDAFTGNLKVKAVSGDVLYQGGSSLKNDINIENVSGGVEAQIPGNAGFVLKCTTTTGSVKNDFDLGKDGGAVGDQKYNIAIKTVTGPIEILKK